jgi:hypothetical protein
MDVSEDPEYDNICTKYNQKIINYSNQLCRKQFLPPSRINRTRGIQDSKANKDKFYYKVKYILPKNKLFKNKLLSGNLKLDKFIKETQKNSKYCDDFIEWIPNSNIKDIIYLTNGGNSKVYFGNWNLSLNISLDSVAPKQVKVVLKSINNSDKISDLILNEVRKANPKKIK